MARVAILGAGFAGAMVAVHLWRAGVRSVMLVERTPPGGRGVAYGTACEEHLLNVPAGEMGAFPNDPGGFARWAGVDPLAFVPRGRYGEYVGSLLAETGVAVTADEAVGLLPAPEGGFQLRLRAGGVRHVEKVVLAIGQFTPPALGAAGDMAERAWYVDDPWSLAALAPLPPDAEVVLVGTGLTAVDVSLSLLDRVGARRVTMVSRHARLPVPQRLGPPHRDWLDPLAAPLHVSRLLQAFRAEVAATGADPRAVLDALRPHVPTLWGRLPWVERRRFLRHLRSTWETWRNRLPLPTAARVEALQAEGRLTIVTGTLRALGEDELGPWAELPGGRRHVARVVNCTGPDMLYRRIQHPLVLDVIGAGLGRPDPLGLGLDVGPDGRLIDEDGAPTAGVYALGAPAKGRWWETMAVAELRAQARDVAARVAAELT